MARFTGDPIIAASAATRRPKKGKPARLEEGPNLMLPTLATLNPFFDPGAVGAAPTAPTLGKELRQSLPPSLVDALDKLKDQIQIEILDPLLCAATPEQLAQSFGRLFPVYTHYYLSSTFILLGYVHGDVQRFSALAIRSYREAERLITNDGPRWIGQKASLTAVQAMTNIIRVSRAAMRSQERGERLEEQPDPADVMRWANSVIGFGMAFSAVVSAVTDLSRGTSTARLDNIVILAEWSNALSVQAYHLTKALGLVREMEPSGPLPIPTDEDLVLANAGLDSYADQLCEEDRA